MPARMSSDEVLAFLEAKPGWIVLSTLGRDDYPYTVSLGYFRLGTTIYMGCRAGTQKVRNITRNPRVSLLLESGTTMQDIKGIACSAFICAIMARSDAGGIVSAPLPTLH